MIFLGVIGYGIDAIVFRIYAGGRAYAMKIVRPKTLPTA